MARAVATGAPLWSRKWLVSVCGDGAEGFALERGAGLPHHMHCVPACAGSDSGRFKRWQDGSCHKYGLMFPQRVRRVSAGLGGAASLGPHGTPLALPDRRGTLLAVNSSRLIRSSNC